MAKKFATFDETGKKTAGYIKGISKEIPKDAIEITDEEEKLYNNGYLRDPDTKKPVKEPERVPTDEELLAAEKAPKLSELQQFLNATDYKFNEYAEGDITEEEFAPTKALRAEWRTAYRTIRDAETIEEVDAATYTKLEE